MALIPAVADPPSGYFGIDLSQIIFGVAVIIVLIGFAYWGWLTRRRIQRLEQAMRDFRELEPEGFEEESAVDAFSEGARMDADEALARQRDIAEHSG